MEILKGLSVILSPKTKRGICHHCFVIIRSDPTGRRPAPRLFLVLRISVQISSTSPSRALSGAFDFKR